MWAKCAGGIAPAREGGQGSSIWTGEHPCSSNAPGLLHGQCCIAPGLRFVMRVRTLQVGRLLVLDQALGDAFIGLYYWPWPPKESGFVPRLSSGRVSPAR